MFLSAREQRYPVPLDYQPCEEKPERCSYLTGLVDFGIFKTTNVAIVAGQTYNLYVELDMPESDINFKVELIQSAVLT